MKSDKSPRLRCVLALSVLLMFAACSGGGSDGGGAPGRTRGTGLRLIHASIDQTPVSVRIGEEVLQTARFAEPTGYQEVPEGDVLVRLERANLPTSVIADIPAKFKEKVEYSLVLFGEARNRNFFTVLLEDPIVQPPEGRALAQVINAYAGYGKVNINLSGQKLGPVVLGSTTGFVELPSGEQLVVVSDLNGREIARAAFSIVDRGEATLVVAGSKDLGIRFTPVYTDLD